MALSRVRIVRWAPSAALVSLLSAIACGGPPTDGSQSVGRSTNALAATPLYKDASQSVQARVEDLLARMSLDEKLGQMTQPDRLRGSIGDRGELDPNEVTELRLGSMLAGGDMAPSPATPAGWADSYDRYQRAALATPLGIPMLYAVDAVHGDANVLGATVFPHNIGLGATRDPALVERIGRATAEEVAATGLDWTFSPCVAVTRDDHWGRVYESFGEVPEIPSAMTSLITGLQGSSLSNPTSILATAKHYMGDGGTNGGKDEGETTLSEADLRAIHLPPFREAVQRNVGAVMVSYSSWNGTKMHANAYLVDGVLKGELGFKGIVITDWDAIELLDGAYGFSPDDVRAGVNAGIDVFMITEQYRNFINLLRAEVVAGRVSMARIDDANRRILTKKFELGLFERPFADRTLFGTIGSAEHRALAREAVQKSQVVLKNDGNILPLSRAVPKLFVAGKSADNIGFQSGGWTVKWQGTDGPVPGGTSILTGIRSSVSASTQVTFDANANGVDGSYAAAIAVVGERPYAEYEGDRTDDLTLDAADLAVLTKLKNAHIPTVVVLVSGRPLDIHNQIGDWAALVASWLPGSEGEGVADVLFGTAPATGTLPLTWLTTAAQEPINAGDGKTGLFPLGFGLTYPAVSQPGRDPRATLRAESYSGQQGTQLEGCADAGCGNAVAYVSPGDSLYFDDIDFGATAPTTVEARVASGASSGTIEYRLDSLTGPLVASIAVAQTGGWQSWTTVSAPVTSQAVGKHRLYVVFAGPGGDFVNLNWFRFGTTGASTDRVDGVTPWRGGATGAYSLVHDDVCDPSTQGVFSVAEPALTQRGLHAGFGVIVGLCDTVNAGRWDQVRTLAAHGHDVFSHSWSHPCMTNDAGRATACDGAAPRSVDFDTQITKAHAVLGANVGTNDEFFIFPYDVCDPAAIAFLQGHGYVGARCGARGVNTAAGHDPFAIDFDVYGPSFSYEFGRGPCATTRTGAPAAQWSTVPADYTEECRRFVLNDAVDEAVRTGGWAVRELHGLDPVDPLAWEAVSVIDYAAHLDHVAAKVASGELWVEGPTAVNRYQLARVSATCALPTIEGSTLRFAPPTASCARVATTLTYRITLASPTAAPRTATQAGAPVALRAVSAGHWLVDADPTKGDVTLAP